MIEKHFATGATRRNDGNFLIILVWLGMSDGNDSMNRFVAGQNCPTERHSLGTD